MENEQTTFNRVYDCPKCGGKGTLRRHNRTPAGKWRWQCQRWEAGNTKHDRKKLYCYSTTDPTAPRRDQAGRRRKDTKVLKEKQFRRKLSGIKRFVITAAQNATPVHAGFVTALKAYCEENGAELVVIPLRYKNPTSKWTASQENAEHWAKEIEPYLYNQRKKLCENLVLLADIKVQPTATYPLSGFETITKGESGILGHTKIQLQTIATPQHTLPKIMTTTGACTVPNYTDSKAGKKGEFHHVFGAVAVEVRGKNFHMRQINACADGSFIDLSKEYFPDGSISKAGRAKALIMGDTHVRFIDPQVDKATFGKKGIVKELDPETLVWHDLLDSYARSPHHRDNPFIEIAKRNVKYHLMAEEVRETIDYLRKRSKGRRAYVVPSNHDDMFFRWIKDTDWRRDPDNAEFYLETALHMVRSTRMERNGSAWDDPFIFHVLQSLDKTDDIVCLDPDESCSIAGIECGFHGDKGPNGSRGTVRNLSKVGDKLVSGHGHSPAIEFGHYRTGTSTYLKLEYTSGPSSWLNTHCVIYANGKRSLINIIDGAWRL